jgi:hypothetical protein
VAFVNHALGSFEVTGTTHEEFSPPSTYYEHMNIENAAGSAVIELLQYGAGLEDDSLMYGTMDWSGTTYNLYTVPQGTEIPEPAAGVKINLYSVQQIAVKPGATPTLWAIGQQTSGGAAQLYTVDGSTGAATLVSALSTPPGDYMSWHNGLWFCYSQGMDNAVIASYDENNAYALNGTPVVLQDLGFGDTASPFTFSSDTVMCEIFGMVVKTVAFYTPSTGVRTGTMPGSFSDFNSVCWASNKYFFVQGSRDGSLERLYAYNAAGTLLGKYMVPKGGGCQIASDGTDVYLAFYDGWLFRIPLAEF